MAQCCPAIARNYAAALIPSSLHRLSPYQSQPVPLALLHSWPDVVPRRGPLLRSAVALYRVRADYLRATTDTTNVNTGGPWPYFKVVL